VAAEVLAGLTLAALGIPAVLAYAKIAGMPLVTGLYTMLLPMAAFAVLGSSRHLVVAADSATAAILAAALTGLAAAGSERYVRLAGLAALLTGGMLLAARLAFLADFLSRTVLVGFLTGVGIEVAAEQLPDMVGVSAAGSETVAKLTDTVRALPHVHWADVAISIAVIAVVVAARRVDRKIPGLLIAVIIAIIVSWAADLARHGVAVVGPVPRGLPSLGLPALGVRDAAALTGVAVSMFVVILAQSAATSRAYAAKYEEPFSQATDLVGLGAANAAAAVSGTFVVNGSPTKTQIVDSARGRSQLSQLAAAVVVLIVLVLLTGPRAYLPVAALAAVVFVIAVELIEITGMRHILACRKHEFAVALLTTAAVVVLGVQDGIILAIIASIVDHLRHSYSPLNKVLVKSPEGHWQPVPVRPGTRTEPGWWSTGSAPACTTPTRPSSQRTSRRWPAMAARCAGWSWTALPSRTWTIPRPRCWPGSSSTFTSITCTWSSAPSWARCGSDSTVTASARPWGTMPTSTHPARPWRPSTPPCGR
jgi:SulP family sulfate permease